MPTYSYTKSIRKDQHYDLVVAGGGPAGVAAAVAAGRLGKKVLLIEKMGCLGGMSTSGLVTAWDSMADGRRPIVGGVMRETVETLFERGWLPSNARPEHWRKHMLFPTRFNPEYVKILYDEICEDAGVEVRFFTQLIDADAESADKRVNGVVVAQVDGLTYVPAKAFVDATGDAFLCEYAGADYWQAGIDTASIMPASLCWIGAGNDESKQERYDNYLNDKTFPHPYFRSVNSRIGESLIGFNSGHIYGLDAVDERSLSIGMVTGRKLVLDYFDFYRRHVPGYEKFELVCSASLMGVRETRRIKGEYVLCYDDYTERRHFADEIGMFNKEIDIHVYDDSAESVKKHEDNRKNRIDFYSEGETYGIPYRVTVPKGWKNLWVAGRCASSDVYVNGTLRTMPAASMMGQAAGTAAVLSVDTGVFGYEIDTDALRNTLREHGAILD